MKKRLLAAALIGSAAISLGVFSGCFTKTVSVASIEKTNSVGLTDYYTVTYTDGSTSSFTVTNGKDGENAKEITVDDVYEAYKKKYGEELTFKEFCELYLAVDGGENAALNSCLSSCLKVYTAFRERENGYGSIKNALYGGSAVVYKMYEDYTYILTNYHVVYDKSAVGSNKISSEITAYLYGSELTPYEDDDGDIQYGVVDDDGKTIEGYDYAISCEYVGGSIDYDVAVIRAKTEDLKRVNPQVTECKVSYDYSVGDVTYAIGNPNLHGISVTKGIISVDSENIVLSIDGIQRSYRSIRTDTALTHGNSGGGLFNENGELIGLNNSGDSDVTSMNYAIPATALTGVADGLIYYSAGEHIKTTKIARLGVTSRSLNSKFVLDEATGGGRIIEEVTVTDDPASGTLASMMGVKKGDILTSITINGQTVKVYRQFQISDFLLTARVGDTVSLGYTRGGVEGATTEVTVRQSDMVAVD